MNRHFSHLILVLISSAWPLMDAQAMFSDESELSNAFKKLHKTKSENPDSGQQLVEKILEDLATQRREVVEKQAQDALREKIEKWKCELNLNRFSNEEQNKLEKQIPQAIKDFEEEQKISHGTDETLLTKLSLLSFQPLMDRLQKLGKNRLLKKQLQRKIESEKKNELLEVKYHYDKENFVFLSENRDSYYKGKNFIPQKQKLEKNDIIEIYKLLKIHKNSPAEKKNPEPTAKARRDFLELLEKQTGFIFLPTSTDGKLNVLIKVLRGPHQQVDYLFYSKQNLPLGFRTDERFTRLEQHHTFVALGHLVFAVPHSGPEEKILSLSTRQVLGGGAMNEVYAMANTLWRQRALSQAMNIPSSESTILPYQPELSILAPLTSVSEPEISIVESVLSVSEPAVSVPEPEISLPEPANSIPQPEVALSEPEVSTSEPEAPLPEPEVSTSQPEASLPEPEVSTSQPEASLPEPAGSIPQPEASLPEPEVSTSQPEASLPEPAGSIPQPEAFLPEPAGSIPQPEAPLPEPEVSTSQPEASLPEPAGSIPQPEAPLPEPEVSTSEPEALLPEPAGSIPQPEVSLPEPEVSISQPEVSLPEPANSIPQPEVSTNQKKARKPAKTTRKKEASEAKPKVVEQPQKKKNLPKAKGIQIVPKHQSKIVESRGKNQKISKFVKRLAIYFRHLSAKSRKRRGVALSSQ